MPYLDFYKVGRTEENVPVGNSATLKCLENQFISIAEKLKPTAKTQPLWIDDRTLNLQIDAGAIAFELCTQIYIAADAGVPPFDVDSAVKLKPRILYIRQHLQKQNLALILDGCDPNEHLIEFFCEQLLPGLGKFLHIAWITDKRLEAPLKGFPRNQPNLLSAIQSWLDELG